MSGFRSLRLLALSALFLFACLPAYAAGQIGIVLLHGKTGMPGAMSNLAGSLTAAGYLVDTPEMCWSKKRIFDKSFSDCLLEVDAAVARLKAKGAVAHRGGAAPARAPWVPSAMAPPATGLPASSAWRRRPIRSTSPNIRAWPRASTRPRA